MTIWYAGVITLLGAVAIVAATLFLLWRQRPPLAADAARTSVYRTRARYFWVLVVGLGAGLVATLPRLPDQVAAETPPAATIRAEGLMWAWRLTQVSPEPGGTPGSLSVPAGRPVLFEVSTTDVSHGFGVYTPDGSLLGQVQAMPGYTNRVVLTFPSPGRYTVLCLEYCGRGHHAMLSQIEAY